MIDAGTIAGHTQAERAANLAGWLAEQGATRLTVTAPGPPETLGARETDLPGLIARRLVEHGAVELTAESPPIRIVVTETDTRWTRSPASGGAG